ncbi:hypothetical protein ABID99_000111 [Mucilaginibacter sp. OAE612]|uniref:hypothetical protein n=1 Tax=Mucilaginibacter sp. OAE612 TaxID=3156444 RepID=UPI00359E529A
MKNNILAELRVGRVRDCSVKPGARRGVAGRKGEDLQRKARAAGNAHVIKQAQ